MGFKLWIINTYIFLMLAKCSCCLIDVLHYFLLDIMRHMQSEDAWFASCLFLHCIIRSENYCGSY